MARPRSRLLPAGTVTFLFTDIEGSTKLLRRLAEERYSPILHRHRALIRTAVTDNGGVEVDDQGDGMLFAFSGARSAITACIAAQVGLQSECWPDEAVVKVRMGLHTGEASPKGGSYAALALHQASRVMNLAHGGQVVASESTAVAVLEALPVATSLHDLGPVPLKDFDTPTRIFQICHPSLTAEFPPLRVSESKRKEPKLEQAPVPDGSSYRTPGTASGFFRTPGDVHVHVDGARNVDEVSALLKELGEPAEGQSAFPGKFNHVLRFAGGPQRDDRAFAQTYRYHTPGSAEKEKFDSFSTTWLGSEAELEPEAVTALARILGAIASQPGAVVELERVVGVLEPGDRWIEADPPLVADPLSLDSHELKPYRRLMTSPIEIHHSIDVPKVLATGDSIPQLPVGQLPVWPNLGGWFLFDKGTSWSYRSSEFVGRRGEYHYAACVGQRRLLDFFEALGCPYTLHTLVEQVLGIWRGGEQLSDDKVSVPALGEWEMSCPAHGHFWVIAANFLGDRSPDVQRAMIQNLAQDVTYTYFLRSHADVLRLGLLTDQLERALIARGRAVDAAAQTVADNVRCVLLPPDLPVDDHLKRVLKSDYFLCPYDAELGGYRLESSGLSGERMAAEDFDYLVGLLDPLISSQIRGLFMSSEESWTKRSSHQAIVCTDLEETAVAQEHDPWLRMLAAYDRIVAREVSMQGDQCLVVRPIRNGYLIVFAEPRDAAAWSRRLQFEVHRDNQELAARAGRGLPIPVHNIALGYGSVSRVLRAHGYDYVGGAIDECIALAAKLDKGRIAMSRTFSDQYRGNVGTQEFRASTAETRDPKLGRLRLLAWP